MINLIHGDCLEKMKDIPGGSVDFICCDPPYGTTACKWDTVIPFPLMWEQLNRIIKPNGAVALFGSEPFSSALRMSNIKNYKYDWIWHKKVGANFGSVRYQPLKVHEVVSVFNKHDYYPQKTYDTTQPFGKVTENVKSSVSATRKNCKTKQGYPKSIQTYQRPNNLVDGYFGHPTQKPVKLIEYLIKTYTNENETVFDFTMGSGTAGVACKNLNRSFIGIEQDDKYFDIAEKRILDHVVQLELK